MAWTDRRAWLLLVLSWTAGAAAQAQDSDGDGVRDQFEHGDSDNDQVEDRLDPDDDGDGLATRFESADPNGDGDPADALDTNGNGTPNYVDGDDDGDSVPTARERAIDPRVDVDLDGIPAYLDADENGALTPLPVLDCDADGDGLTNQFEDRNGNVVYSDEDADADLLPDYLDADDDGDGLLTRFERGDPAALVDTDGDGIPDYLDADDDGDGVPTAQEHADPSDPPDGDPRDAVSTAMSIPDYLNPDDDGDSVPTALERPDNVSRDSDGDRIPDYLDEDDDDDHLLYEGRSDTDSDGTPNYLDADDDGDGVPSLLEIVVEIDTDGDGSADPLDADDDGDGLPTQSELGPTPNMPRDSDGDGRPDYRDADDDGDGIPTLQERTSGLADHDGDGQPDYLDADDDGDGIPTANERGFASDVDGDGLANWLDLDADGDGLSDAMEGTGDLDGDGIPNFLDGPGALADAGADAGAGGDAGLGAPDGGAADGGGRRDAGVTIVTPAEHDDGCSAAPGVGSSSLAWLIPLWALGLLSRRRRIWRAGALVALALSTGGCGEEDDDEVTIDGGFGPFDAGLDGAHPDAGFDDASVADASSEPDAGGLGSECVVEGEPFSIAIEETAERGWAAIASQDAVHLAVVAPTCTGLGAATGTRIDSLQVASTGAFGAPRTLTSDDASQCRLRRSPALAVGAAGALDVYFTANSSGSYEIYRQDVALTASAERVTEDPPGALDNELGTVAARFGDSALLAYVNQSAPGTSSQLVTRRLGLAEHEIVAPAAGQSPSRLTLVVWPRGGIAGVLGWVSDLSGALSLRYQPLSAAGTATGAPVELSTAVGSLSALAFASTSERAAVVYTVQTGSVAQLRFRELGDNAQPSAEEVKLTSANRSVGHPAIAAYAQGYVIAFREIPDNVDASASLRLLFVDAQGKTGGERRLADAARGGGGSAVFVMNDGRLIVLWSDADARGSVLRGLRARCL